MGEEENTWQKNEEKRGQNYDSLLKGGRKHPRTKYQKKEKRRHDEDAHKVQSVQSTKYQKKKKRKKRK